MQSGNLRLFLGGRALSNVGSFSQIVALSLLVLELTGSGLALGVTTSVQALPMLLAAPWSGPLLDRLPLRWVLLAVAVVGAIQASLLAVLTLSGQVNLAWVLVLSLLLGVVVSIDRPAGQAFLAELVPHQRLPSAVSLSSSTQAVGRLVGPALAAGLYAWRGSGAVFAVNAVSFLAAILSLLLLRSGELLPSGRHGPEASFVDALGAVWRRPLLRSALLVNALVGLLAFNFPTFFSTMATLAFNQPSLYGIGESVAAAISLLTSLALARKLRGSSALATGLASVAFAGSLAWVAAAPLPSLFLAGMCLFGVAQTAYSALMTSLIQLQAPRQMLGRVMTLHFMGILGTTPLGGLLIGWVIDQYSPRAAIGLGAASAVLGGLVLLLCARPRATPT